MRDDEEDDLQPENDDSDQPGAETTATVQCPYCGESCEIALDPGGGAVQQYVEDCQVCCNPWQVLVTFHATGQADVFLERAD